jgi:uncharacterized protein YecT (DUF1311 family)
MRNIIGYTLLLLSASVIADLNCEVPQQTQLAMNQCAGLSFEETDAELNRVYGEIKRVYADDPTFLVALRDSQRAWIKLRDADMNLYFPEREAGYYGSITPFCKTSAITKITQERVEFLRQWLIGVEEGDVCSGSIRLDWQLQEANAEPMKLKPLSASETNNQNSLSGEPNPEALKTQLFSIANNWNELEYKADLNSDVISSWVPESGIRGRFQIMKAKLGLSALEAIVGEQAYVSGPHSWDIALDRSDDFGRYNPSFLTELGRMLNDAYQSEEFINTLKPLYDAQLKRYLRVYYLSFDSASDNQPAVDGYLQAINTKSNQPSAPEPSWFLYSYFDGLSSELSSYGYDDYETYVVPAFWVRRTIDGTADAFHGLLVQTLNAFDPEFMQNN